MHIFKRKREREIDYTHWDIHAMARTMDPVAWAAFDALPKGTYYETFEPVSNSFHLAIGALKAGYKAPWGHLWSDEELQRHIDTHITRP